MRVLLLRADLLSLAIIGARTCYDSFHKSDTEIENMVEKIPLNEFPEHFLANYFSAFHHEQLGEHDKTLLQRLINLGHESVIEHVCYTFFVDGLSRLSLQQLVRHRLASYSVQSTRYVLKKILKQINTKEDVDKFVVYTPEIDVQLQREEAFRRFKLIKELVEEGKERRNDELKYLLPENLKTQLVFTMNARELRHFIRLRADKHAHWEIRTLAVKVFNLLPQEHRETLFFDLVDQVNNAKTTLKEV